VEYEDTIKIATPEGVDLAMVLAGAGSRAAAALLDLLVKGAVFGSVLLLASFAQLSRDLLVGLLIVLGFCLLFAYDVLFEVLGSGRTPGKRWSGLRVVLDGGRPIGLGASAVRNILRVIDILPGVYGAGLLSVAFTSRNQRLGDLAAGSLVVRERRELGAVPAAPASGPGSKHDSTAAREHEWDVSAISADELATVREFLSRRGGLRAGPRENLATQLAEALRPRVGGAPAALSPEVLLEGIAAAKAGGR